MTVEIFLTLLIFCSTTTSLITEAVKKFLDDNVPYNILVLIIALFVGFAVVGIYYLMTGVTLDCLNFIYILLMGVANWIGAMIGYDKVKQLISQIGA